MNPKTSSMAPRSDHKVAVKMKDEASCGKKATKLLQQDSSVGFLSAKVRIHCVLEYRDQQR